MLSSAHVLRRSALTAVGFAAATLASPALFPASGLAQTCQFLSPVGGNGVINIVTKTIGPGNPLGRPNWNTDFFVTRPYSFFKLFFTADSSVSATYPVQAYLKFTDGSNLQVFNANITPEPGTGGGRVVPAVPGKQIGRAHV